MLTLGVLGPYAASRSLFIRLVTSRDTHKLGQRRRGGRREEGRRYGPAASSPVCSWSASGVGRGGEVLDPSGASIVSSRSAARGER
jgi:hypothetical protein